MSPTSSILALFHTDAPVQAQNPYASDAPTLLKYLSTAIFTVHSLAHVIAQKEARDRSIGEPVFGLEEDVDGIVVGLGSNDRRGTVVEMEYRRKSGRAVKEWFFIVHGQVSGTKLPQSGPQRPKDAVILLEDHPLYQRPAVTDLGDGDGDEGLADVMFSLGLTERQKKDRDAVVLPYFDAQKEGGGGQGGRILYDMGVEDDFDEEEDEI
jgi:elongator complex protein 5